MITKSINSHFSFTVCRASSSWDGFGELFTESQGIAVTEVGGVRSSDCRNFGHQRNNSLTLRSVRFAWGGTKHLIMNSGGKLNWTDHRLVVKLQESFFLARSDVVLAVYFMRSWRVVTRLCQGRAQAEVRGRLATKGSRIVTRCHWVGWEILLVHFLQLARSWTDICRMMFLQFCPRCLGDSVVRSCKTQTAGRQSDGINKFPFKAINFVTNHG